MSLGEFEQVLLLALMRIGAESGGNDIRMEIESRTGRVIAPGALYTAMDRLEQRGHVTSRMGSAESGRGARRVRYYTISPLGERTLAESYQRLHTMAHGLSGRLLEIAENS